MAFNVKFYQGTQEAYDTLTVKESKSFYLIDGKNLYLGSLKLTNDAEVQQILQTLAANAITIEDLYKQLNDIKEDIANGGGGGSVDTSDLESRIKTLEEAVASHNEEFKDYKDAMSVSYSTLDDKVKVFNTLYSELSTTVTTNEIDIEDKHSKLSLKVDGISADIQAINQTQAEQNVKIDDVSSKNNVILTEFGTLSGKVNTLIGTDKDLSVRQIAAFEVAKVVAEANEKFDTLKEIADWIINDTAGVAEMNIKIATNTADITALKTTVANLEARIKANEDAIAAINNSEEGVLAQAKIYADDKASAAQSAAEETASDELDAFKIENNASLAQINSAIEALQKAVLEGGGSGGEGTSTEIIETMIDSAIAELQLGTAAKANVADFDVAGAANNALVQAKAYSDASKQEAMAYVDTALTWGHIPVDS